MSYAMPGCGSMDLVQELRRTWSRIRSQYPKTRKRLGSPINRNNALAEVDLKSHFITKIIPLGYKDNSLGVMVLTGAMSMAASTLRHGHCDPLFGPDGIAAYRFRGGTYLVTANEGDSRDLEDFK